VQNMPFIMTRVDVMTMDPMGSDKTITFFQPQSRKIRRVLYRGWGMSLLLWPNRELALYTLKFCQELGPYTEFGKSLALLLQLPAIPFKVDEMSLRTLSYVDFDEANCLFEMGFADQLQKILV